MDAEAVNKRLTRTLICVGIAGLLFITSIFHRVWWLFIVGAVFDWLPLPTGWMRIGYRSRRVKRLGILHGFVTLVAYAVGVTWLFKPLIRGLNMGYVFLLIWFTAVLLGVYVSEMSIMDKKC